MMFSGDVVVSVRIRSSRKGPLASELWEETSPQHPHLMIIIIMIIITTSRHFYSIPLSLSPHILLLQSLSHINPFLGSSVSLVSFIL